jgi:periplasmic divalent cation tolerance protein
MQDRRAVIVLTTVADRNEAGRLADVLVDEKLAACVNRVGVVSTYRWKGAIEHGEECLLIIKTAADAWPRLRARIGELSSYEVPEIVEIDVARGEQAYLAWLLECVSGQQSA